MTEYDDQPVITTEEIYSYIILVATRLLVFAMICGVAGYLWGWK